MGRAQAGGREIYGPALRLRKTVLGGKEHSVILVYSIYNNICATSTSKSPQKETFRQN
jgi:hypothetical protein